MMLNGHRIRRGPNNPILQTNISIAELIGIIESHFIRCGSHFIHILMKNDSYPCWTFVSGTCYSSYVGLNLRFDVKIMSAISQTSSQTSFIICWNFLALRYADIILNANLQPYDGLKNRYLLGDSQRCVRCCHITFHGPFHYWRA